MGEPLPAKLLPPPTSSVWPRDRLFEELDDALGACQMLWISASPGAGKSALIASYLREHDLHALWYRIDEDDLDPSIIFRGLSLASGGAALPEYAAESPADLGAFARRYFELFFRCLPPGTVLVFDDFVLLPESPLCELLQAARCRLLDGMKLIVISRDAPPAMYARLHADGSMAVLDGSILRLTVDEAAALAGVSFGTGSDISSESISLAHDLADGWITGFLLILESIRAGSLPLPQSALPNEWVLFDYLTCEVLGRLDCEERNLLLKVALLPVVPLDAVEAITGNTGMILERLHRRHGSFIRSSSGSNPSYIFSPIFRRFLLAKGNDGLTPIERYEITRKAADWLACNSRIEEAIDLIAEGADWQAFEILVSRQVPLRLMQGAHAEVHGWLKKVPENVLEQEPGLCCWMGACRMPSDFVESRNWFERAYTLYCDRQDIVGRLLAWSGIVETIFLEWGDFSGLRKWIVVGEQLLEECGELPKGEIGDRFVGAMFNALMQGQPDHPRIGVWADRLFELLRHVEDDNQRLLMGTPLFIYYTKWLGEHARAEIVFDMLRPPPERFSKLIPMARIMRAMIECVYHWNRYDIAAADRAIQDGIQTAERTGIHAMDFLLNAQPVYAGLSSGEYARADHYLGRLRELIPRRAPVEQAHYHYLAGWRAMLFDDPNRAMEHLGHCTSLANEHTAPMQNALNCIALAQVHHALEEDHLIPPLLSHARMMAQGTGSPLLEFMVCYSEAAFALDERDDAACLTALGKALKLANRRDYLNFAWCLPRMLARLCVKALEASIEADFVRRLIHTRCIVPDAPPIHLENWPWPLKVHTLGRFSLVKDDVPLSFSRKAQRKPIEMFKALIALGGREIPEMKLSDILWPDVDGDSAHSSFTTTLSRLRKLVGEAALIFSNGCLTLDARRCWVDVWAFQRVLGEVQEARDVSAVEALVNKAIGFYHGPFLNAEDDTLCLMAPRDQMRRRLGHAIMDCSRRLKETDRSLHAFSLCRKIMAADPNAREFLERLMGSIGESTSGDLPQLP